MQATSKQKEPTRPRRWVCLLVLVLQAALVVGFAWGLRTESFPLGVPGEWEWPRLPEGIQPLAWQRTIAIAGLLAYSGFAALGWKGLSGDRGRGRTRQATWLLGLVIAGIGVQWAILFGAPEGFGLAKWVTLAWKGSSGYYNVARDQIEDTKTFWADYPTWIQDQDALHVGTHPPGLFLWAKSALSLMERFPELARFVDENLPGSVRDGFREIIGPLPRADRASLALTGALTLFACVLTVVPLYLFARGAGGSPATSWASAVFWPLIPSAILFQPTADTAFPLLSTAALAFAVRGRPGSAIASGVVLAIGMLLSLVFLAVGLIVALMSLTANGLSVRQRLTLTLWTGVGFLALTLATWVISGANPFVIWWWNQTNHARFYEEFPRSYLAWIVVNPIELAVAIGLPAMVWIVIGLANRTAPRGPWLTLLVLVLLTLTGRSLSEVARLWLPFLPPLLIAAGAGFSRLGGGPITLAITLTLIGSQALVLQEWIQVVYPV